MADRIILNLSIPDYVQLTDRLKDGIVDKLNMITVTDTDKELAALKRALDDDLELFTTVCFNRVEG